MKPEILTSPTGVVASSQSAFRGPKDKRLVELEGYGSTDVQAKACLLIAAYNLINDCRDLVAELKTQVPDNLLANFKIAEANAREIGKTAPDLKPSVFVDEDGRVHLEVHTLSGQKEGV